MQMLRLLVGKITTKEILAAPMLMLLLGLLLGLHSRQLPHAGPKALL